MNKYIFALPRNVKQKMFRRIIEKIPVNMRGFFLKGKPSKDKSAKIFDRAAQIAEHLSINISFNNDIQKSSYRYIDEEIIIGRNPDMENYCEHICHEFGHRLQHIVYGDLDCKNGDEAEHMEKEAEDIGYMLYKAYFSDIIFIDKSIFKVYKGQVLKNLKEQYK